MFYVFSYDTKYCTHGVLIEFLRPALREFCLSAIEAYHPVLKFSLIATISVASRILLDDHSKVQTSKSFFNKIQKWVRK